MVNVPDEAVEAALDELPIEAARFFNKARMRNILEAAAPHLMAAAKAEALESAAAHLDKAGKLWWGDSGCTVMEEGRPTRFAKLTDWLRSRSDTSPSPSNPHAR